MAQFILNLDFLTWDFTLLNLTLENLGDVRLVPLRNIQCSVKSKTLQRLFLSLKLRKKIVGGTNSLWLAGLPPVLLSLPLGRNHVIGCGLLCARVWALKCRVPRSVLCTCQWKIAIWMSMNTLIVSSPFKGHHASRGEPTEQDMEAQKALESRHPMSQCPFSFLCDFSQNNLSYP
jgi:hypothetical protein